MLLVFFLSFSSDHNVIKLFYAAAVPTFGSSQENLTFHFFLSFFAAVLIFHQKLKLRKLFWSSSTSPTPSTCVSKLLFIAKLSGEKNSLWRLRFEMKFSLSCWSSLDPKSRKQKRKQSKTFGRAFNFYFSVFIGGKKRIILSASFDSGKRQRSPSGLVVN